MNRIGHVALMAVTAVVLALVAGCTPHTAGDGSRSAASTASTASRPASTNLSATTYYISSSGYPRLAVAMTPATQPATLTFALTPTREAFGTATLPAADSTGTITVSLHVTVEQVPALSGGSPALLTVTGWLRPRTLDAHLVLHLDNPAVDAVLDTGTPDIAAARSAATAIMTAANTSDFTSLAAMIAPDMRGQQTATSLAAGFAKAGLTDVTIAGTGAGQLRKLQSGYWSWIQPYTASATQPDGTRQDITGDIILIDEIGHWWLLTTVPTQ